jgi:predicted GNAT family N-acyltransferase
VTVNASLYAVPVHQRLGFVATGEPRSQNGITSVPMRLQLG